MFETEITALYGENASLLDEMYESFKKNPASVSKDWQDFFLNLDSGKYSETNGKNGSHEGRFIAPFVDSKASSLHDMGIINLLNAYRRQGHLAAKLDPLGILKPDRSFIDLKLQNLLPDDLEKDIDSGIPALGRTKLKNVVEWYEKTYCNTIGSEQYYIVNDEEREWIQNKMESTANSYFLKKETRLRIFQKLFKADFFENFLAKKFVGKKRFSLEGGETFIPILDAVVEMAGEFKMENLVLGMAHRGRLNVLVNTFRKPASLIFAEFEEKIGENSENYADVKYHLGFTNIINTESGHPVKLSMLFNPSHLEAVNPVVTGSVRARQKLAKDKNREKIMPILIHGDAAFAGQGVVAETLNLMNLEGYTTGGTFHIVVNNQIGFTTLPNESRSTLYATDLAKGFQIPIFHVNGDDPEAAHRVVRLALEYREKFRKDVIIDLICYRRLGHNEMDEPAFTQPYMYDLIKQHPPTINIYEAKLLKDGDITKDEIEAIKNNAYQYFEDSFNETKNKDIKMQVDTMKGNWANLSKNPEPDPVTTITKEKLERISDAMSSYPADFHPNQKLIKLLENRKKMGIGEIPMDWGFGELLAFGTILDEGHNVRISGQDAQRGTFTHRHAVLVDTKTNKKYAPIAHISDKQGDVEIINSSLSEYAVVGFEYGYSLADPASLVIWEAQFGDFANTAQVIFDQFISSSEIKWQRMSGLVVLLPHGYEGQGPEHSSARLERYLQLCAENNIQVANCTTPAQYFHLLRRQLLRKFRKPLIIMTPKSLLRHPMAISNTSELIEGGFQEVLPESSKLIGPDAKKLIFCSGKVYYDLIEQREKLKADHVAIARVEQLYPFPEAKIREVVSAYKSAEVYWVQEEPQNQGAWFFMLDNFSSILDKPLKYVGRKKSASPAAGQVKVHMKEQDALVKEALS